MQLSIKLIACSLLFSSCFLACQEAKKQAHLSADFFIRYSYDSGDIRSEARFRDKDGTLAELPEAPTINTRPMHQVESAGALYLFSDSEKFAPNYHFQWRDISGEVGTADIEISPITDFYFSEKKLNSNAAATLNWQGKPLMDSETLVLLWEKDGQAISMTWTEPTSQANITLAARELSKLSPGTWSLYVVRKQRKRIEKPPFKAKAVFEFYSATKTFEVY